MNSPQVATESDALLESGVRLFNPSARQKLLAFASLLALMVFFTLASPNFLQTDNIVGILQATAVNGVLAIACTFVIITGGIDLSVGTLMTFCSVMAGVFLTYWGLPFPLGIVAAIFFGALCGFVSGVLIAKLKIPPFIATLGHDDAAQGAVAGDLRHQADLLQRHAGVPEHLAGLADRLVAPGAADPERGADPVRRRGGRQPGAQPDRAGPLHLRARQQRGGGAAVGRQRGPLEDRRLLAERRHLRHRRPADRLAPELGAAGARPGLRARRDRRGGDRRHVARRAAPARSSAPSSARSS